MTVQDCPRWPRTTQWPAGTSAPGKGLIYNTAVCPCQWLARAHGQREKREKSIYREKRVVWSGSSSKQTVFVLRLHRSYNQGLISADRSNKATLLLTIPRCLLSRLQRISRAQLVKLLCNDRDPPLRREPSHNHMVQAEAIDTRVIGQPFSFLAWILF